MLSQMYLVGPEIKALLCCAPTVSSTRWRTSRFLCLTRVFHCTFVWNVKLNILVTGQVGSPAIGIGPAQETSLRNMLRAGEKGSVFNAVSHGGSRPSALQLAQNSRCQ